MSVFEASWLSLRSGADGRARSQEIDQAVSSRFAMRDSVRVLDFGCGTGANLRALASVLPSKQNWLLVDHDAALLENARVTLSAWADRCEQRDDRLVLEVAGREIAVAFQRCDLLGDIDEILEPEVDLVTASALFDLASETFIKRVVGLVSARGAAFHSALSYNGRQSFAPRHPSDNEVLSAFHWHQMRDKGLGGAALGPGASVCLTDQLQLHGYHVLEGDSPWTLDAQSGDGPLICAHLDGIQAAVLESGLVEVPSLERWRAHARTRAHVGHTDTFGIPDASLESAFDLVET